MAASWVVWGGTSTLVVSLDGAMGSDGPGISVWGGGSHRWCWIWRRIVVCYSYWPRMSTICRNRALCVAVSVLNKFIMVRNSVPDIVIKSSNVGSVAGGTGGVAGGSVKVAWGIDGVARAIGIDSVGRSCCYACSACAGTRDAGLGGAASSVDSIIFLPTNCVYWSRVKWSR